MKKFIYLEIPHTLSNSYHNLLQASFANKSIYTLNKRENKTSTSFMKLPSSEKDQYRIIKGINHFGLHQYFNRPSNVKYITLMCDPIERILSLYSNIKTNKSHQLHKTLIDSKMSLKEFVSSSVTTELSNYQISLISGIAFELDKCNFDIYNQAKRNMNKHFAHIGIQEFYDLSISELKNLLSPQKGIIEIPNNSAKQLKHTISNEVLDIIHERNIYDIILYNKKAIKYRKLLNKQAKLG